MLVEWHLLSYYAKLDFHITKSSLQFAVPKQKISQLIIVKQKDFFMKLLMKIESFLGVAT
jgi:hypothetical protein